MFKVLSNLKESIFMVIAIVALLIVQANADLAIPDYTSKIVNVGIQQSGVENSSPEIIRKTEMDNILLFSSDDNEILSNYTLVKSDDKVLSKYKIQIQNEDLYIQNNLNKEEQEKLNNLVAKPIMFYSTLTSDTYKDIIKNQIFETIPVEQRNSFEEMQLIDIIKVMPESALNQMLEKFDEKLEAFSGSIMEQAAIEVVKNEYNSLGINMTDYQNNYLIKVGLKMLGIAFLSMLSAIGIIFFSSRVAAKLGKTLRKKVFTKVLKFSSKEFKEFSTASLITRSTNDIQQIQQLIAIMFRVVVYAPIMGLGGLIRVITNSNNSMSWIVAMALGIIISVMLALFIVAMPKFKKLQSLIDRVNAVSREMLTGVPVVRAFSRESYEESRFEAENKNLMKVNIFVNKTMSLMMPALILLMDGITILIIWVGGHIVDEGIIQVGDMMAFIQYAMHIVISFLFISIVSIMIPRAQVSAKRINEIIEKDIDIEEPEKTKNFDISKKGLVEFNNVSFKYPDAEEELLTNITFTAKPGETTAIIGSTGSGKSTIVNLIPRFYDVTSGELKVDGINVKDVSLKKLRDIIGFVPQKGVLFSGTIESNIKYSDEKLSDEKMKAAAEIAQATEFIDNKEEKYSSEIAQGGNNVSGGQKQRLSIARAIAKDPEIFVFDDSFSALDFKTDKKLRAALKEKTVGKTVIIIAQRISTIMDAEQIIVLDEGKIVGKGKHKDLLKNCSVYKQIALSQLSEEELA